MSSTETRKFHVGAVLTVARERLVTRADAEGSIVGPVYEILNYLTDDDLFTHQLPRAGRACEGHVRALCPWTVSPEADALLEWLAKELEQGADAKLAVDGLLAEAEAKWGAWHELTPLPEGAWKYRDPFSELIDMAGGPESVVVVESEAPHA